MRKIIVVLVIFALCAVTAFAGQTLNINLDESKYISDSVQIQKLQYERESLKYNGTHIIIGSLDGITGIGTVKITPEFFTLTFELKTNSSKFAIGDSKEAQVKAAEENTKAMIEFKEFLVSIGVKEEDMTTTQYSVESVSKTLTNAADVIHRLKVKFNISAKIGEVYKKIETTDIKVIDEPVYEASEEKRKEGKILAYEYAMKDVFSQAETLAKFGKFEIGDIKSISENNRQSINTQQVKAISFRYQASTRLEPTGEVPVPYSVVQEMTVRVILVCSFDMIKKVK